MGYGKLPVVEASVIVSRVTDVAKNAWQHNQLSCNKATRDAKCFVGKNHIVTKPFMYRDQKQVHGTNNSRMQHVSLGKPTSSRNNLPWVVATRTRKPFFTETCFGSGPLRGDHGWTTCEIVVLGEGQLFAWARRCIHHATSGVTVTCEDVNLRVWSRKATWGKAVLVVAIQSAHFSLGIPYHSALLNTHYGGPWVVLVTGVLLFTYRAGYAVQGRQFCVVCLTTGVCRVQQGIYQGCDSSV